MPDATYPGDIIFTGQRRTPGSVASFPAGAPEGGIHSDQLPDDPGAGGSGPAIHYPCTVPALRREWNLDAAAAAAKNAFLAAAAAAGETGLSYRERGAFLLRKPDGSVVVGPIVLGSIFQPGQQPSTTLDHNMIGDRSEIIGVIHSHSPGNHLPSPPSLAGPGDAGGLAELEAIMDFYNPGSGVNARMYIVAETGSPPKAQINVYAPSTIADATSSTPVEGPEVNPEAQSC